MKHDKTFYQNLPKVNGFKWAYFDNGLHSFTKKTDQGYLECKMTDQDIQDPIQFEFMLSQGLAENNLNFLYLGLALCEPLGYTVFKK